MQFHAKGSLNKGDVFSDTRKEGEPYEILLGERNVITGLEYGLEGMQVGGKRRLTIAPHLAYRDKGVVGIIPPNAVLRYEVELLSLKKSD